MKIFLGHLCLAFLALLLAGCIPEEAIGTYESNGGSLIEVKNDGRVSWRRDPSASDELQSLGIVDIDRRNRSGYLVMHSASRWIGTNFKYDENYEKIWVEWIRIDGGDIGNRDVEYTKKK